MVILKKIVIMTEHNRSNCSGIVKFENFAGRTSCFVRILGLSGKGVMCIKCGDNVMYCGDIIDGEHTFNAIYDLNNTIQIVVVADGSVVCMGSNKGKFSPNSIMRDIHKYYASITEVLETPTNSNQAAVEIQNVENQMESSSATVEEVAAEAEMPQNVVETKSQLEIESEPQVEETEKLSNSNAKQNKKVSKTKIEEPFYKKIQKNLSELFESHEKDEELTLLIPSSKWVRVPIEGDGYYVVGVIENDGVPDIICYGVPDKDDANPPANNSDCRQWMEIEKGGRGYWMMYQSAVSGATLTTSVI